MPYHLLIRLKELLKRAKDLVVKSSTLSPFGMIPSDSWGHRMLETLVDN